MKKIILIGVFVMLSACTDVDGASKTIKDYGMNPVEVGGYAWFQCGQGDLFHTKFVATNPEGRQVSGTICKGLFKNSTMRLD